jgi:putative membrane protein
MMWYWGNGVPWWCWVLGFAGVVIFWGLIVRGIVYVVRSGNRSDPPRDANARTILDARLARGEIDTTEYTRLHDALGTSTPHSHNGRAPVGAGDAR